jgi:PKD repeat protein
MYTVNLTVTDDNSATDSIEKTITVANIPPIADFTYEPTEIKAGELIYFNSTSYDPDGTIVNWTWDFDDGNTAYGEYVTHQYSNNGTYIVNLTVMDDDSATDSIENTLIVDKSPPVADFTYDPDDPIVNENVYFYDESTDLDGVIVSWNWDFGDGYYSGLQNPTHQYSAAGIYIVNLTVTDDDGLIDYVEKSLIVNSPPDEPTDPYPADGETDIPINLTLTWNCSDPDNDPLTYDIYFGNTSTPVLVAANHTNSSWELVMLEQRTRYYWQIVAWDDKGASTSGPLWDFISTGPPNNKPYAPVITGPNLVQINVDYTYIFQSSDPDGDDIRYIVTWGDSNENITDFYPSNTPVLINHTWITTIIPIMILKMTATAEDELGAYSTTTEIWVIVIWFKSLGKVYSTPLQKIQNVLNNQHQPLQKLIK